MESESGNGHATGRLGPFPPRGYDAGLRGEKTRSNSCMQSLGIYGDVGPPVVDYSITDLVAISGGMGRAVSPSADAVAGGRGRAVSPLADAFEEHMEGAVSPRRSAMTD